MYKIGVSFNGYVRVDQMPRFYIYDQELLLGEQVVVEIDNADTPYFIATVLEVTSIDQEPIGARWIVSRIDDSQYKTRKETSKATEELARLRQEETMLDVRLSEIRRKIEEAEGERIR